MTTKEEQAYSDGAKTAWTQVLREAIRNLGDDSRDENSWRIERAETVAMLRSICREHGDNDWDDDLHLGDVIDKHLWRHLEESPK